MNSIFFNNGFSASSGLDIGKKRNSNQDRIIFCPDMGFFSVIDGMGGLLHGGETAEIITEILPGAVREILENNEINKKNDSETALIIKKRIQEISDIIYNTSNKDDFQYGATISCLLLLNDSAIFVNLGDSRAYLLPRNSWILRQITEDHNLAAELVRLGALTHDEARNHSSSSILTRFAGMTAPSDPDCFIESISPGDRILLCSDGMHGMADETVLKILMRSSRNSETVCRRLIETANEAGGRDNISVVYIKIEK